MMWKMELKKISIAYQDQILFLFLHTLQVISYEIIKISLSKYSVVPKIRNLVKPHGQAAGILE